MAYHTEVSAWKTAASEAQAIRTAVFVQEQGVDVVLERDGRDPTCLHVLVRDGAGQALATGRLLPDDHIGRLAVLASVRGKGLGSLALTALVSAAYRRGARVVRLNAQADAEAFYRRHGFVARGAVFMEAGIAHLPMSLHLQGLDDAP